MRYFFKISGENIIWTFNTLEAAVQHIKDLFQSSSPVTFELEYKRKKEKWNLTPYIAFDDIYGEDSPGIVASMVWDRFIDDRGY